MTRNHKLVEKKPINSLDLDIEGLHLDTSDNRTAENPVRTKQLLANSSRNEPLMKLNRRENQQANEETSQKEAETVGRADETHTPDTLTNISESTNESVDKSSCSPEVGIGNTSIASNFAGIPVSGYNSSPDDRLERLLNPGARPYIVHHPHDRMSSLADYSASLPHDLRPSDRAIFENNFVSNLGRAPHRGYSHGSRANAAERIKSTSLAYRSPTHSGRRELKIADRYTSGNLNRSRNLHDDRSAYTSAGYNTDPARRNGMKQTISSYQSLDPQFGELHMYSERKMLLGDAISRGLCSPPTDRSDGDIQAVYFNPDSNGETHNPEGIFRALNWPPTGSSQGGPQRQFQVPYEGQASWRGPHGDVRFQNAGHQRSDTGHRAFRGNYRFGQQLSHRSRKTYQANRNDINGSKMAESGRNTRLGRSSGPA